MKVTMEQSEFERKLAIAFAVGRQPNQEISSESTLEIIDREFDIDEGQVEGDEIYDILRSIEKNGILDWKSGGEYWYFSPR